MIPTLLLAFQLSLSTAQQDHTYNSTTAIFKEIPNYLLCSACPEPTPRKKIQVVHAILPAPKTVPVQVTKPTEAVPNIIASPEKEIVYFNLNSSTLQPPERSKLDQLEKTSASVIAITGYTCDIGTKEYNDRLARKRAEETASYLHITAPIVQWKGKCCYADPVNKALNRRVEIDYTKKTVNQGDHHETK